MPSIRTATRATRRLQDENDPTAAPARGSRSFHVEGAVESAGEFGISAVHGNWEASSRLRYLGPIRWCRTTAAARTPRPWSTCASPTNSAALTLYGELLNVLNHKGNDVRYYYPTFVPGITAPGDQIETYLSRSEEPRTVRVGIKYSF